MFFARFHLFRYVKFDTLANLHRVMVSSERSAQVFLT